MPSRVKVDEGKVTKRYFASLDVFGTATVLREIERPSDDQPDIISFNFFDNERCYFSG